MRPPKGFGKNYFSLAAIQATVSQTQLHATGVRIANLPFIGMESDEDESDDDASPSQQNILNKESDCSCFCSRISQRVVLLFRDFKCFIPTYLKTYSVSSPPPWPHTQHTKIYHTGSL